MKGSRDQGKLLQTKNVLELKISPKARFLEWISIFVYFQEYDRCLSQQHIDVIFVGKLLSNQLLATV